MLALFKSAPLVDEQEQQWLIDTFMWAVEHFDSDYFLNQTQIILPNSQFFPDSVSSIEDMAKKGILPALLIMPACKRGQLIWSRPRN